MAVRLRLQLQQHGNEPKTGHLGHRGQSTDLLDQVEQLQAQWSLGESGLLSDQNLTRTRPRPEPDPGRDQVQVQSSSLSPVTSTTSLPSVLLGLLVGYLVG